MCDFLFDINFYCFYVCENVDDCYYFYYGEFVCGCELRCV